MKGIAIAKSQHHINKSFYLKNLLGDRILDIISFRSKSFNGEHFFKNKRKVRSIKSFKQIEKIFSKIDFVIIFGFHANKDNIELKNISDKYNVKLILFQETHMLTTHLGKIYNIIMNPDYLIPSSDFENEMIEEGKYFPKERLKNFGNIFGQNYLNFLHEKTERRKQKNLLLVFSAPINLDPIDGETFEQRLAIIKYFQDKKAFKSIILRLHPFEDTNSFLSFLSKNKIKLFLDDHNISLFESSLGYSNVVSSTTSESLFEIIYNPSSNIFIYSRDETSIISEMFSNEKSIYIDADLNLVLKKLEDKKLIERFKKMLSGGEDPNIEKLKLFFSKEKKHYKEFTLTQGWDDFFSFNYQSSKDLSKIFKINVPEVRDGNIINQIELSDTFSTKALRIQALSQTIISNFRVKITQEFAQKISEKIFVSSMVKNFKIQSLIFWQYIRFHNFKLNFSKIELKREVIFLVERDFYNKNLALKIAFKILNSTMRILQFSAFKFLIRSKVLKLLLFIKNK